MSHRRWSCLALLVCFLPSLFYAAEPDGLWKQASASGVVLQTLARLIPMAADPRFLDWATRIGDAYIQEILPANNYLPGYRYDFEKKTDSGITRRRDHGNEMIVGLALLHALETDLNLARAER